MKGTGSHDSKHRESAHATYFGIFVIGTDYSCMLRTPNQIFIIKYPKYFRR